MVGAIILAAGRSRRFGSDKRLAHLPNGQLVLMQTIARALAAFDALLLTLRHDDDELEQDIKRLVKDDRLLSFKAPDSDLGMGHSLANAIDKVRGWDAAFICLGDMPFVSEQTLAALKASCEAAKGEAIILPTFAGKPGHPVGFPRCYFDDLAKLSGDRGAKSVVQAHQGEVTQVPTEDPGVLSDIDQPQALNAGQRH